jgi:hypothetical protein
MKYHELSDEAKGKAVEWMQESNIEHYDDSCVIDDWKALLSKLGFIDVNIWWSGFWSQGDGACFTGMWNAHWLDMLDSAADYTSADRAKEIMAYPTEIRGLFKLLDPVDDDWMNDYDSPIVTKCTLTHRGSYYHENSILFDFDNGPPTPDDAMREFSEWCQDLMRMIYKDLEADYEWATGVECAVEHIEMNDYDYDFNEEGEVQ